MVLAFFKLFQCDSVRGSTGRSALPKLKPVHLSPNSFQKMSVKLAVQTLSNEIINHQGLNL
jgi:hypothetical protein